MISYVTDTPDIVIPPELKPADGRFGSGPSKVRPEAVAALADVATTYLGTSHRQKTVKSKVGALREGLRALFSLPDGYEVALGNGGTTTFWDAATFGLIERRSQHLSFGEFSSKFAAAAGAAPHLDDPEVITSEVGTHPEAAAHDGIDLYALTHNETSTGVMMPVTRPAGADGLVAVDATSAAAGLPVDPAQFDAYYFAPQKAFASDGGLWVALLSPAAQERIAAIDASGRWSPASLDLAIALDNSTKDQTYNTPALATIFLMEHQVAWFNDHGGLSLLHRAVRHVGRDPLHLGGGLGLRHALRQPAPGPLPRGGDHRPRGRGGRRHGGRGPAGQRHRRHRALPQAGPEPAPHRHVPGHRPRGRGRPVRLRQPRGGGPRVLKMAPSWRPRAASGGAEGHDPAGGRGVFVHPHDHPAPVVDPDHHVPRHRLRPGHPGGHPEFAGRERQRPGRPRRRLGQSV